MAAPSPRRTALVSVFAAAALVVVKLVTGLATGSLGLISEAMHSGTDLVAALLTFFALGVAARPADVGHAYGHGKAEHLAALAEAAALALASLFIAVRAVQQIAGNVDTHVDATWYALAVIAAVIVVDATRMQVSLRAARRYRSAALQSNAFHFGSDLGGSIAVLIGLVLVRWGFDRADSLAALFVAVLVLMAAGRLMRMNVDVLMDRVPAEAEASARAAIAGLSPAVELRRLRMREAAGRQFADVVIGMPPEAPVGQGHDAADRVEEAVQAALPESDVVVHVEPYEVEGLREGVHAAAQSVQGVREVHNVTVLDVDGRVETSLHLKLPGDLPLAHAHEIAEAVEQAIVTHVPQIERVQTHLEPLASDAEVRPAEDAVDERALVLRVVREALGRDPRELRFLHTDGGLVAFLTLGLDPNGPLADAHASASEIEARIRRERPEIADVIVHTEP